MPAESQAQRAYLNQKFGHQWVKKHHFDNKGKLPEHKRVSSKHPNAHHHQSQQHLEAMRGK